LLSVKEARSWQIRLARIRQLQKRLVRNGVEVTKTTSIKSLIEALSSLASDMEVTARTFADTGNLVILQGGSMVGWIEIENGESKVVLA
jgi:hypothetical protein